MPATVSAEQPLRIDATSLQAFDVSRPDLRTFGPVEFVGGLILKSDDRHFGALSGLNMSGKGEWLAISDTGYWVSAKLERDGQGRPAGLANAIIGPLLDKTGTPYRQKWSVDAEGLAIRNGRALIAMEQGARVLSYEVTDGRIAGPLRSVFDDFPGAPLRNSFGLEAVTVLPDGKMLALSEGSRNEVGDIRGFLIGVAGTRELSVRQRDGFYITDVTAMPNGDLLLLERNFTPARGAEMRLRAVSRDDIEPDTILDGDVWLTAGRGYAVDNMEGISAWRDDAGDTRIGLVSDDNHWPLQRNLYLEFVVRP